MSDDIEQFIQNQKAKIALERGKMGAPTGEPSPRMAQVRI